MLSSRPGRILVVLAVVAVTAVLAATAAAVLTGSSGGAQVRVDKRTQNSALTTTSTTFVDLPGAAVTVSLSASRLIDTSFTGETQCTGSAGNWCSARVLATNTATGATTELDPVSGIDFALDSVGASTDNWEGHAMDRSHRFAAGTYRISVQWAVTSTTTTFRLDDWHFAVYQNV